MKQTLLFLIVLTICGSLTKPPIQRACGTKVQVDYYLKGKLRHTDIKEAFATVGSSEKETTCKMHPMKMIFSSDSVVFQVHIPKQQ